MGYDEYWREVPFPSDAEFQIGDIVEIQEGTVWDGTQLLIERCVRARSDNTLGDSWYYQGECVKSVESRPYEIGRLLEWHGGLVLAKGVGVCPSCEGRGPMADYLCEECRYGTRV